MWKLVCVVALIGACASTPKTAQQRSDLAADARVTLQGMIDVDPTLPDVLSRSAAYVVFPSIGKGGVVVGAAHGRGVLFEGGRATGFIVLNQGSIGAQVGGQTFSELIVLQSANAVDRLKRDQFSLGADISAVALTTGAAVAAEFREDVAVFIKPIGGAFVGISVSGQKLDFDEG